MLAPDGLVCISTNNLASWHNVISLALGWQPMPIHVSDDLILGNPLNPEHGDRHRDAGRTHLRLFTARALAELCEYHGLTRVSTRTVGYYPLPPRVARAGDPDRSRSRRLPDRPVQARNQSSVRPQPLLDRDVAARSRGPASAAETSACECFTSPAARARSGRRGRGPPAGRGGSSSSIQGRAVAGGHVEDLAAHAVGAHREHVARPRRCRRT